MSGGRPVMGAFSGLVFGISLAVLLLVFGVFPLDSILLVVVVVLGLVLGIAVGAAAPFRRRPPDAAAPPVQQYQPPPQ